MSAALLITGNKKKIRINPFTLSGNLYPLVSTGYTGQTREDKDADPEIKTYTNPVRISSKKQIKKLNINQSPVSYEPRQYFMISDNETIVDTRLEFVYNGISLRVLQRRKLIKFNSIIGYEYELKDITEDQINA